MQLYVCVCLFCRNLQFIKCPTKLFFILFLFAALDDDKHNRAYWSSNKGKKNSKPKQLQQALSSTVCSEFRLKNRACKIFAFVLFVWVRPFVLCFLPPPREMFVPKQNAQKTTLS